jgi:hypothetical protein
MMEAAPTCALVLIAISATLPHSSPVAIVLVWLLIAIEELASALITRRQNRAWSSRGLIPLARFPKRSIHGHQPDVAADGPMPPPPQVLQQQIRCRTASGEESIRGTFRAAFVPGQRIAIEHLVFCPILSRIPTITAASLDELECTVRPTHVYRYGARLEVKLGEPCEEPLEIALQYEVYG